MDRRMNKQWKIQNQSDQRMCWMQLENNINKNLQKLWTDGLIEMKLVYRCDKWNK